jgi:hypothetical protein
VWHQATHYGGRAIHAAHASVLNGTSVVVPVADGACHAVAKLAALGLLALAPLLGTAGDSPPQIVPTATTWPAPQEETGSPQGGAGGVYGFGAPNAGARGAPVPGSTVLFGSANQVAAAPTPDEVLRPYYTRQKHPDSSIDLPLPPTFVAMATTQPVPSASLRNPPR